MIWRHVHELIQFDWLDLCLENVSWRTNLNNLSIEIDKMSQSKNQLIFLKSIHSWIEILLCFIRFLTFVHRWFFVILWIFFYVIKWIRKWYHNFIQFERFVFKFICRYIYRERRASLIRFNSRLYRVTIHWCNNISSRNLRRRYLSFSIDACPNRRNHW